MGIYHRVMALQLTAVFRNIKDTVANGFLAHARFGVRF